jgi:hypothetical protein
MNDPGLLQDREEAGFQGAASPLAEREVSSHHPPSCRRRRQMATLQRP